MKILEIYNQASSAEQFVGDRFSYFQETGRYEMHLIATPNDSVGRFAEEQRIKYYPVNITRQVSLLNDIVALVKIIEYMRKNEFDCVVTNNAKGVLLGQLAAFIVCVPHRIIVAHGVLFDTMHGIKRQLIRFQSWFCAMLSHMTICVSDSVRRRRLEEGIDRASKQVVLGQGTPAGVDTIGQFNPDNVTTQELDVLRSGMGLNQNDFVIGFCGRLVKDKGIVELVDAFNLLRQRNQEKSLKLMIIGRREKWDSIPEKTMLYLQNCSDIIFTGFVPHSEIQKYYALMNVFVLPSYREGFPTVILEASAMSIPVVVSRSTGCIDSIIEGQTGFYTDITPESIADSVSLLFDRPRAMKMGENGRNWMVSTFEHTIVNKYWLDFFDSIS